MNNLTVKTISSEAVQQMFANEMKEIKHFEPREYLYDVKYNHWAEIEYFGNDIEREIKKLCFLLYPLLSHLEVVRGYFKKPVIITNGIRDIILWHQLYNSGYAVSKTTDHSYGLCYNRFGVGAIDHFVVDAEIEDVYNYEKSMFEDSVGQLILYRKSRFIHMSNPREFVFSKDFIDNNFGYHQKFIEWDK